MPLVEETVEGGRRKEGVEAEEAEGLGDWALGWTRAFFSGGVELLLEDLDWVVESLEVVLDGVAGGDLLEGVFFPFVVCLALEGVGVTFALGLGLSLGGVLSGADLRAFFLGWGFGEAALFSAFSFLTLTVGCGLTKAESGEGGEGTLVGRPSAMASSCVSFNVEVSPRTVHFTSAWLFPMNERIFAMCPPGTVVFTTCPMASPLRPVERWGGG